MSTFIECNNCGEVKDVEAKSVTLPYYCSECVAADQFQKDITPKAVEVAVKIPPFETNPTTVTFKSLDEYPTLTKLVSKEELHDVANHHYGLNDAEATVENTTLLIQDLELQLQEAKAFEGLRTDYIKDLEANQKAANKILSDMSDQLTDAAELGERDRRIAALTQEALDQANQELKDMTADRDYIRKRLDHWRSEAVGVHQENKRLNNRGLIAQIRNA